jgi:molybdopterin-guanine dinucleotide biosynthesis protein A
MGGIDKGLQPFHGTPLAQHALQRLHDQTPTPPELIAINANRNNAVYAAWGVPVWPDPVATDLPQFAGPLLGFLAGLRQAETGFDYLLTVPCDSPLFPLDLLGRMLTTLEAEHAEIALALGLEQQAHGTPVLRTQPVFCLLKATMGNSLQAYLESGGRKIDTWLNAQHCVQVAFNESHDNALAFANANTLDELHALEKP